jgi:hypothetical protein
MPYLQPESRLQEARFGHNHSFCHMCQQGLEWGEQDIAVLVRDAHTGYQEMVYQSVNKIDLWEVQARGQLGQHFGPG